MALEASIKSSIEDQEASCTNRSRVRSIKLLGRTESAFLGSLNADRIFSNFSVHLRDLVERISLWFRRNIVNFIQALMSHIWGISASEFRCCSFV